MRLVIASVRLKVVLFFHDVSRIKQRDGKCGFYLGATNLEKGVVGSPDLLKNCLGLHVFK
jgi:hypothetical protein